MEENERKPIFTNNYLASEESYRQMYRRIRKGLILFSVILFGGGVVYAVYAVVRSALLYAQYGDSFFKSPHAWILLLMSAYLCFAIVWIALSPRRLAKKSLKRLKEMSGGKTPEIRAAFFDDAIVFHNDTTNGESVLNYTVFRKTEETQDLFLLWTQQKQIIPIAKLGFDGTDIVGFRAFIDEKCPNAKRKWRKAE